MSKRPHTSVLARLQEQPQGFEFFQAVRLLNTHLQQSGLQAGSKDPAVGRSIRFRDSLTTVFPPSEIVSLEMLVSPAKDSDSAQAAQRAATDMAGASITPSFFGLLGYYGALPTYYTEQIAEREMYHRDRATRQFMEIFSNRATALLFQAWKKYRLELHYESGRRNVFMPVMLALAGCVSPVAKSTGHEYGLPEEVIARYSGLLRQRPISAVHIERLLSDYFRVAVRVEQFVGAWYAVPVTQRTTLGGAQAVLGKTALCGARIWQRNLRVRLWVGPLDRGQYEKFLANGTARRDLANWLEIFTGNAIEYEIRPILRADAVRPSVLTSASQTRLGADAFLVSKPAKQDRTDINYVMRHLAA